jgi:hypothetical protein
VVHSFFYPFSLRIYPRYGQCQIWRVAISYVTVRCAYQEIDDLYTSQLIEQPVSLKKFCHATHELLTSVARGSAQNTSAALSMEYSGPDRRLRRHVSLFHRATNADGVPVEAVEDCDLTW